MGGERTNEHSPWLHWRCASARASPANLEWGTTRCNESMRDHNRRTCCRSNYSASCWKNAHRCRARYLKRAMTMMPMMRCTTTDSVLVADGSRCARRGMIALKVTLCRWRFFFSPVCLHGPMSSRQMVMMLTCVGGRRRNANSSGGGKAIDFSCEASSSSPPSPLFACLSRRSRTTRRNLMKWKLNFSCLDPPGEMERSGKKCKLDVNACWDDLIISTLCSVEANKPRARRTCEWIVDEIRCKHRMGLLNVVAYISFSFRQMQVRTSRDLFLVSRYRLEEF